MRNAALSRRLLVAGGIVALALADAPRAQGQAYGTAALECEPILTKAEWLVQSVATNNWFNENGEDITAQQRPGALEHLYQLFGAAVRDWYRTSGETSYGGDNPVVPLLMNHAARLGALGAGRVALDLVDSDTSKAAPPVQPPPSYDLSYEAPMLTLSSQEGAWSATFPYYFMIGHVGTIEEPALGPAQQIVMLSTLAGKHEGMDGASQSTILLVFGPDAEPHRFVQGWLSRMEIAPDDRVSDPLLDGGATFRATDDSTRMRKEAVSVSTSRGELLIAYMGLPGTFECNRPDFLSFLRSLEYEQSTP